MLIDNGQLLYCEHCGKEQASKRRGRKFCSYECYKASHAAQKRVRRRRAIECHKNTCPVCDKVFFQDRVKPRLYCSSTCIKKAYKIRHRERVLAAELAVWNKKKYGGNYLKVLGRDGSKCVQCGSASIMVHHINNRGDKCTIVGKNHDMNNLITVCQQCHRALHKLDWAFDGEALIIKSEAFKPLLGTSDIRVLRREVMPI